MKWNFVKDKDITYIFYDLMSTTASLNNYNVYGDTRKSISNGKLVLTTTNNQYWILIRWGGSFRPISELQGKSIKFQCEFECEQTVTFESNVNNALQRTSTTGEITMNIPSDATQAYFSIKSANTTIYVDNIIIYVQWTSWTFDSVKDKFNIATFNQWSCGDYSTNLEGFLFRGTRSNVGLDDSYSINGIHNIKLSRTSDMTGYFFIVIPYQITQEDLGKTLTVTANIKNNLNASAMLQISKITAVRVYIPSRSSGTFSVSRLLDEEGLEIQIASNSYGDIYLDNITITIQ